MHFIGFSLALLQLVLVIFFRFTLFNILLVPIFYYGFGISGHLFFERTQQNTSRYPWLSFIAEARMFKEIITGRRDF